MFDRKMFTRGQRGAHWHPDLVPGNAVVQCAPHKGLSGFHISDVDTQFRKRGISHVMLCSMSANLCVESHLRDAEEHGYGVTVISDATASLGPDAYKAILTIYAFIAHESIPAEEALSRLA